MSDAPLNIVLFSGTADKLHAAAMDRPVNILLQYWALDAFRTERLAESHGLAWDSNADGASRPVNGTRAIPWLDTFRMAKELGSISINACSGSLETLGIEVTELDAIVDSAGGIATFLMNAEDGQIVFI